MCASLKIQHRHEIFQEQHNNYSERLTGLSLFGFITTQVHGLWFFVVINCGVHDFQCD